MRLLILPYAHSKKIFLNNLKPNTEYFYTSIEKHIHNHESGHDSIDDDEEDEDESSGDSSDDGQSSSRSDSSCPQSDKDTQHQSMVLIICLNMTDHK